MCTHIRMKKEKWGKKPEESSSSLALISPAKRQVLAGLVDAQRSIKNKFKRAYTDRITRERKLKETFKPITASIATLKSADVKKKNVEKGKKNGSCLCKSKKN